MALKLGSYAMGIHEPCQGRNAAALSGNSCVPGSVLDLLHEEGFNHQAETEVGTLGEECSSMLKEFFRELRVKGKEKKRLLREEAAEAEGREKQEPAG